MPLFWGPSLAATGTAWPTATATTTSTTTAYNAAWWSNAQTASTWTNTATTQGVITQQGLMDQMRQAQTMLQQIEARDWQYQYYDLYQRPGLASLFQPSRPAIITRQDEARRDRELYRRAIAEHDGQEAARLLRQIEQHERLDADQRRIVEQQREIAREQQQQREIAKLRARELLFEHLSPQQRDTFDRNGWFVVEGGRSKTQYRIRAVESMVANVDVLNKAGSRMHRLCAHVQLGRVPLGDQLLAQKVMIELAEDDFLRIANRHAA